MGQSADLPQRAAAVWFTQWGCIPRGQLLLVLLLLLVWAVAVGSLWQPLL